VIEVDNSGADLEATRAELCERLAAAAPSPIGGAPRRQLARGGVR
jgi:hypothetical protein